MKEHSILYKIMGCEIHYEVQGKCKNGKTWNIYWFNKIDPRYKDKAIVIWSTKDIPISEMEAIKKIGNLRKSERAYSFHPVFCFFVSTKDRSQVLSIPLCELEPVIVQSTLVDRLCWMDFRDGNLEIGFKVNELSLDCFEHIKNICFSIQENHLSQLLDK